MKVVVTGAGGLVGSASVAVFREAGDSVSPFLRKDCDITDSESINVAFKDLQPDLIVNCAAYTDVDGAESDRELCFRVNVDGVRNLAAKAKETGCPFVSISTDYVFDGEVKGFYAEDDVLNPISVYGRSKVAGEEAAAVYENSIVVRTGWIFGSAGTNFLSVLPELLLSGKRITAISDSFGTPTYAPDLAARIMELAKNGITGVVHVTNAGEGASYYDFASRAADLLGVSNSLVEPVASKDLSRPAPRPVNSRLACKRAALAGLSELPHWNEALSAHIDVIKRNRMKKAGP